MFGRNTEAMKVLNIKYWCRFCSLVIKVFALSYERILCHLVMSINRIYTSTTILQQKKNCAGVMFSLVFWFIRSGLWYIISHHTTPPRTSPWPSVCQELMLGLINMLSMPGSSVGSVSLTVRSVWLIEKAPREGIGMGGGLEIGNYPVISWQTLVRLRTTTPRCLYAVIPHVGSSNSGDRKGIAVMVAVGFFSPTLARWYICDEVW